jgi:50S ribosomal protein L16 3-hydroxylase
MLSLRNLLGDTSFDDFLQTKFTRIPFSGTATELPLRWLNLDSVMKMIETKKAILRIVKNGSMVLDYIDLSEQSAKKFYQSGHTLLLKNAERADEDLSRLAREFESFFHTPVDIQIYSTPEGENAFGWHFDLEEVFIFQIKGSKEYTLRQNTVSPNPVMATLEKDLGFDKETSSLSLKVLLEAGDWLYIPSGWWHRAETKKESLHASLGLMPKSAIDLISELSSFLAKDPFWRTRLPLHHKFETIEEENAFFRDAFLKLGKDLGEKFASAEYQMLVLDRLRRSQT